MKRATIIHLSDMRPNRYGGFNTTTLCRRLRTLGDGMNLTAVKSEVTCKFCLARMNREPKKKEK